MPLLLSLIFLSFSFSVSAQSLDIGPLSATGHRGEVVDLAPDGSAYVVGRLLHSKKSDIVLIRFLKDGSRDASFGKKGEVVFDYGQHDFVYGLKVMDDGIYVAGNSSTENSTRGWVLSLDREGQPKPAFAEHGVVFLPSAEVHYLAASEAGRLYAAGFVREKERSIGFAEAFLPTGQRDLSFGKEGSVLFPDVSLYGMAFSAGRLAVTGFELTPSGSPDCVVSVLDDKGKAVVSFNHGQAWRKPGTICSSVALSSQQLWVGGYTITQKSDAFLARFDLFRPSPAVEYVTDVGNGENAVHAVALFGANKVVAAGDYTAYRHNRKGGWFLWMPLETPDLLTFPFKRLLPRRFEAASMALSEDAAWIAGHKNEKMEVMKISIVDTK